MKIIQRKEVNKPQPAIDTICDSCGAIYDLLDCTICSCGKILCPDCQCKNPLKNSLKTNSNLLPGYEIISSLLFKGC